MDDFLQFDFAQLAPGDRYKLITGVIVPRPIAWVTTLNPDGSVNAAPFSYFNMLGSDPAILALGVGDRERTPKDTAANIRREREFVVNLVPFELAGAMNLTASDFPHGESELDAAGLTTAPSSQVRAPRIAQSPAHLECREVMTLELGRTRVVLGEVLALHLREDLLLSREKFYVESAGLDLIGRMGGRGGYVRTTDRFELPRLSLSEARAQFNGRNPSNE